MPCHYCRLGNAANRTTAPCMFCGVLICTDTTGPYQVHGSRCHDGCREVACEAHIEPHARLIHNARTEDCFPYFSGPAAASGFFAAVQAVEAQRAPTAREAADIGHTLNTVSPGHQALRHLSAELPLTYAYRDGSRWARSNEEHVLLTPDFFDTERLLRVAAICLRSFVISWTNVSALHEIRTRRANPAAVFLTDLARRLGVSYPEDIIPLHDHRHAGWEPFRTKWLDEAPVAVSSYLIGRFSRYSSSILDRAHFIRKLGNPAALADWLLSL
jgi:hypothetical protein